MPVIIDFFIRFRIDVKLKFIKIKHYMFYALLAFSTYFCTLSTPNVNNIDKILICQDTIPDQMPYFAGCQHLRSGSVEKRTCSNQSLHIFISKNLVIPSKTDIGGVVYVSFDIKENGTVTDVKILRGLSPTHDEAALSVIRKMPIWLPALRENKPLRVKMTLPIRFMQQDDSQFSNGFQLTWGNFILSKVSVEDLLKLLDVPITVRDHNGNLLQINELLFERQRGNKIIEAQSRGIVTNNMKHIIKRLHSGDVFTITATVQQKGQFYYVSKIYTL